MDIASPIVALFGGRAEMARKMTAALGRKVPKTTIQYWQECGHIPIKRQPDVLRTAEAEGIALAREAFVAPLPPPEPAE